MNKCVFAIKQFCNVLSSSDMRWKQSIKCYVWGISHRNNFIFLFSSWLFLLLLDSNDVVRWRQWNWFISVLYFFVHVLFECSKHCVMFNWTELYAVCVCVIKVKALRLVIKSKKKRNVYGIKIERSNCKNE